MTTPQAKFFDTVKKDFPENQDIYFIDSYGKVMSFTGPNDLFFEENIIAVPFTGFGKIYEDDVIKIDGQKYVVKFNRPLGGWCANLLENPRTSFGTIAGLPFLLERFNYKFEIIGSSLTNPELLENK